jgi:TonB family protein
MVWVLAFCSFLVIASTVPNPSLAQESDRKLKSGPPPKYPELASRLKIKGTARVQITIAKDGNVKDVKELGGNPLLLKALVEAVKKWRYEASSTESVTEVKFEFQ